MLTENLSSLIKEHLQLNDCQLCLTNESIERLQIELAIALSDTVSMFDMEDITTDVEKRSVKTALKQVKSIVSELNGIKKDILASTSTTLSELFDSLLSKPTLLIDHLNDLLKDYDDKMGTGSAKRAQTLAVKKEEQRKQEEAEQRMILTFKCPNEDARQKLIEVAKILGCEQL